MRKKFGTRKRRASAQPNLASGGTTPALPLSKRVRLPDGTTLLVGNMSMRGELVGLIALLSDADAAPLLRQKGRADKD